MTNSEQSIREFAEKWCLRVIECMKDDDYIMHDPEGILSDLTSLISEHYVSKEVFEEQRRIYLRLFDEEINCMYCEAKIRRGSAIILCKECAENTEV